jgi:hypothetical protein
MSLVTQLPAAILDTILGRLAFLFLTGAAGDLVAAHHAARQMLIAYHPETEDELCLAAEIISFSLHALEALSQAAGSDLSLNQELRLRGSAVSLSRESHKSQRKLDQLQKARGTGALAQPAAAPQPVRPGIDNALALIEATREAMASAGKNAGQTWTQGYQQRLTAKRIAENLKKNQANAAPHIAAVVTAGTAAPAG